MNTVCVTLDIDWAHDTVIHEALDLLAEHAIKATIFITHRTETLDRIRAEGHEVGVHPNFNPLLAGDSGSVDHTLGPLRELAPEAKSVRSHSLVRSTRLSERFNAFGFTHESNIFVPEAAGAIAPWLDPFGLTQVPIRWEDDLYCINQALGTTTSGALICEPFVCDFHPIHLFLNTVDLEDYERTRPLHHRPAALREHRRPAGSGGSRDQLLALAQHSGNAYTYTRIGEFHAGDFGH